MRKQAGQGAAKTGADAVQMEKMRAKVNANLNPADLEFCSHLLEGISPSVDKVILKMAAGKIKFPKELEEEIYHHVDQEQEDDMAMPSPAAEKRTIIRY